MAPSQTSIESPRSPLELDDAVEWFERRSGELVLLEERSLDDVRAEVREFEERVQEHLRTFDIPAPPPAASRTDLSKVRASLISDHACFAISVAQLDWFLRIVEQEDHGGHRQALGQYGRVFAEALRRHRNDERAYLARIADRAAEISP
ncbi:MAG: hypothetical protein WA547_09775 [Thermoplasmata archaeon]